jgi:ligand-binding sensor domain-containing protein/two-component sensor histidine kinase
VLLFACEINQCYAQEFPTLNFKSITENDGLADDEVLSITQDDRGIMWFGTANGLSRYDGSRFKNYYVNTKYSNAPKSNLFDILTKDTEGNIWAHSFNYLTVLNPIKESFINYNLTASALTFYNNQPLIFENENLWTTQKDSLQKYGSSWFKPFNFYGKINTNYGRIVKDKLNNFWGIVANKLYSIDILGKKDRKEYTLPFRQDGALTNIFFDSQNQCWISTWGDGLLKFDTEKEQFTKVNLETKLPIVFTINEWIVNDKRYIVVGGAGGKDELILINPKTGATKVYESESGTINLQHLFVDKNNTLWAATTKGVQIISAVNSLYEIIPVLNPEITKDENVKNSYVYQIRDLASGYWVSKRFNSGIFWYDKNWKLIKHWINIFPTNNLPTDVYDFMQIKDEIYLTTEYGILKYNIAKNIFTPIYKNDIPLIRLRNIEPIDDSTWMIRSYTNGVFLFNFITNKFIKQYPVVDKNKQALAINYILKTNDNQIIASTNEGLQRFDKTNQLFTSFNITNATGKQYIGMAIDKNNVLWAGTDIGLVGINLSQQKIVKEFNDYPEMGIVSRVAVDDNNNVWFNCKKGYWCWQQQNKRMVQYNVTLGLPKTEGQGCFKFFNNSDVYAGGLNAIVKFSTTGVITNSVSPKTLITDVEANNENISSEINNTTTQKEIKLQPHQKNIGIYFSVIDYSQGTNYTYYYKLNNSEWVKINKGFINLNNLSTGNYTIVVKGLNNVTGKDATTDTIKLFIAPYWYQTWWFKALVLLGVATLIYAFIKFRTNQIKKREQQKIDYENKMALLEMQNLRTQMNPHFIFNSLNSINSFIVENKTNLASDYLTKFSRLIRLILENSKNEIISLEKELETLKLYLLMESLRFHNKFEYSITVHSSVDEQTKIPSMIIQPYIENAIWHGLLHKKEKGKVQITINKINEKLEIVIEDDGVGIKKAAELKSKNSTNNKSFGMQITAQRLTQLNHKNTIEIIDSMNANHQPCGTKVILTINQLPS